ncbi:conserved hypothetical protein [Mesorhizobium metallidurans STM 2683]|uniref:Uncharacterized protein n=1 Tax=Mesorhizobium metallidurans STM 2683 TaxID=1297569 RepID=M5EJQ1_9HYPH|nr:conserved hypothetical protein [Mesorhizobium metallidurans STM 2683]
MSAVPKQRYNFAGVLPMLGRILPLFLCPMLLFGGGCSRSYDGSVVIPRPLDVRRIWDKPPPQAQADQLQLESDVFPVAPQMPRRSVDRRSTAPTGPARRMTRVSNNPPVLSGPAKPLACRNVSEPGKRARMVCE